MNMNWIDWAVVAAVFAAVMLMAFRTKKHAKSTADFLSANRSARRYLLAVAEGIAGWGAISIIGRWQLVYSTALHWDWWQNLQMPLMLVVAITGYMIYRYRESRALTLGQLLEMRYSPRFRITAAIICFTSGLVNYGIFPAVGASFMIHYCGLPATYSIAGLEVSMYVSLVIFLTVSALVIALFSGQIAIIITDFLQSTFASVILLVIVVLLLIKYPLSDVFDGLLIAEPQKSMVNPFDAGGSDFNPLYFLILIGAAVLNRLSWQGSQGYLSSAMSPHEAKMAGIVGRLRTWAFLTSLGIIALVAYAIMHHPNYTDQAQQVTQALSSIENQEVRDQMIVPVTMTMYLPVGMMGAFAAVMLIAFLSTNDTYMHSWGSIFVQDILIPLRKKPLSNRQHLIALRLSIAGVALFAIIFSCIFRQTTHILYFFAITGAIWMGGCGIVILGALYSRRGTTAGAYAALISGSLIATTGFVIEQVWFSVYGTNFLLTGQEIWGVAMVVSVIPPTSGL